MYWPLLRSSSRSPIILFVMLLALAPALAILPFGQVSAAGPVGDGTPASCTEGALQAALDAGGLITFDCGGAHTIELTTELEVRTTGGPKVVDGGGLITISGVSRTRVFDMASGTNLTLKNLTVSSGQAGRGAGIQNRGTLTVINTTFSNNVATAQHGGAILNFPDAVLTVEDSRFLDNSSQSPGGGAIFISARGTVTITGAEFNNNQSTDRGGAIRNNTVNEVSISSSQFIENSSGGEGGAIYNHRNTDMTVDRSEFIDNSGGGGGVIFNGSNAAMSLSNSELSGNQAGATTGGIRSVSGTVDVYNSTFAENSAVDTSTGRDLANEDAAVTIVNSTLESMANEEGTISLKNSIIAGGSGASCDGSISSEGYNISDDDSCGFGVTGDLNETDPLLDDLGSYGGPTQTRRPRPDSPAVNRIPPAQCALDESANPLPDQRGVPRPQNTNCDVGGVELTDQPIISQVTADPATFDEPGSSLISANAFVDPTLDNPTPALVYAFDCDGDGTPDVGLQAANETTCDYPDSGQVTVNVEVSANGMTVSGSVEVTINNLPPAIDHIMTEVDGDEVIITVTASDPAGVNDPLEYAFDCVNDGDYELDNDIDPVGRCPIAAVGTVQTIGVQVSDGDGGVTTATTGDVTIAYGMCANPFSGLLRETLARGCGPVELALSLPDDGPVNVCVMPFVGLLRFVPSGDCVRGGQTLVLPDDGPLRVCVNPLSGLLRAPASGACAWYEIARQVGGSPPAT